MSPAQHLAIARAEMAVLVQHRDTNNSPHIDEGWLRHFIIELAIDRLQARIEVLEGLLPLRS